jgi:hypothetical protein
VFLCCAAADVTADGISLVSIGIGAAIDSAWLSSIGAFYPVSEFTLLQNLVETITAAACADVDVSVDCASSLTAAVGGVASSQLSITNSGLFNYSNPLSFSVITDAAGLQGLQVQPSSGSPAGDHAAMRCRMQLCSCMLSCGSSMLVDA